MNDLDQIIENFSRGKIDTNTIAVHIDQDNKVVAHQGQNDVQDLPFEFYKDILEESLICYNRAREIENSNEGSVTFLYTSRKEKDTNTPITNNYIFTINRQSYASVYINNFRNMKEKIMSKEHQKEISKEEAQTKREKIKQMIKDYIDNKKEKLSNVTIDERIVKIIATVGVVSLAVGAGIVIGQNMEVNKNNPYDHQKISFSEMVDSLLSNSDPGNYGPPALEDGELTPEQQTEKEQYEQEKNAEFEGIYNDYLESRPELKQDVGNNIMK